MEIVSIDKIPKANEIKDTPVDNLMEVYKVCLSMEKLCTENDGVGLSATQVGIPWRLFIVKHFDRYEYYVNCDYYPLGDINEKHKQSIEGCLSIRTPSGIARTFLVERHPKINVKGRILKTDYNLKLEDFDVDFENDVFTVIFQHEIDHSRGILISQIGIELDVWK